MSVTYIRNIRAVLPDRVLPLGNVLLWDGKIAALGNGAIPADAACVEGDGGYLFPGFIDVHVHGGGGADFMDATPEAFETAVRTHLQHGTTLMQPTAMSATEAELAAFLRAHGEFCRKSTLAKLAPTVHLEGPYFSGATGKSSGAQPGNLLRRPDPAEIDRLLNLGAGRIRRWDAAPEVEGAECFARIMKERGILCAIAHSNAIAEEAEQSFAWGFSHVTHFYNAVTGYHKRDQKVCAGVVEATYLEESVTVELICDGCHIPRDVVRLALKIKGAQNVSAITDATRLAGTDQMTGRLGSLQHGTDVIVEDGVAKLPDRSCFAGSISTMDRCLRVLCRDYGVSLPEAACMLSLAPARLLRVDDTKGSIVVGKDADLVLTDEQFRVKQVFVGGKAV